MRKPLWGVPIVVKDLEDVAGLPTSYGTDVFRTNVAKEDSVQVARLRAAGAIVVGKSNTPIFGATAITKNRAFGVTRNPFDLTRTPGGSSGGTAAAVASRMCPVGTAADGGGSIRIPAAFVGAFGLKPSFGRIPQTEGREFGMQKFVDCVHFGPITRCVEDAALYLDVVCGYHWQDPKSLPHPGYSYVAKLHMPLPRLRIGFSAGLGLTEAIDPDVLGNARKSLDVLRGLGHDVIDLDRQHFVLPDMGRHWPLMMGLQEMLTLHGSALDSDAGKERVEKWFTSGWDFMSRLKVGRIGDAQRQLASLNDALGRLFENIDVLMTPGLPTAAYAARGPMATGAGGKDFDSPMHAVCTMYPFNFSGHPAAVLRSGFTPTTPMPLPTSIQFVARRHRDDVLLQLCKEYEDRAAPFETWPEAEAILKQARKLGVETTAASAAARL